MRIDENTPGFIAPGTKSATIAELSNPAARSMITLASVDRAGYSGNNVPARIVNA